MSKSISPPDYSSFSIADLEATYAHLRSVAYGAGNAICCVPQISGVGRVSPVPAYLEARTLNAALDDLAAMADRLRVARFATADQKERALLLLIKYELDFGEPSVATVKALLAA